MLSLFNRFLSRLQSNHLILGNRNLVILILEYLEGEDLFQIFQVCFAFRTTIQSVPSFEILMLKYTMKESNLAIDKLQKATLQTQAQVRFPVQSFSSQFPYMAIKRSTFASSSPKIATKRLEPDFTEDKWVNFVDSFHCYAKEHRFKILKKSDFDSEKEWKDYKLNYTVFYYRFVDHIRNERLREKTRAEFRNKIFSHYEKLVKSLNFNFHYMTNYRYFTPRSEREKAKETKFYIADYF
jgi:hypothetical protein